MAQGTKSTYYRALKDAGYVFEKHYRDYTKAELQELWSGVAAPGDEAPPTSERPAPEPKESSSAASETEEIKEQLSALARVVNQLAEMVTSDDRRQEQADAPLVAAGAVVGAPQPAPRPEPKVKEYGHNLDPNEHAGVTLNTHRGAEVLEVDEHGNEWYQKEVTKPAFPKPRGRRVLRYQDPGVAKEKIKVGDYVEEFEVAGDPATARPSEIKITLPSYQTGIYRPPNMPFRVHTYNGVRGFSLQDVQEYYGGADLVPDTIKRCYVSTDLCYDIQSTIRTIETEYRERVLKAGRL